MATGSQITPRDLPATLRRSPVSPAQPAGRELNLRDTEATLILRALEDCRGNRSDAAQKLGISRRTLHRRLKDWNISKRSKN
jgi:transcriptional regulator of acetoin/glycerol metabolism